MTAIGLPRGAIANRRYHVRRTVGIGRVFVAGRFAATVRELFVNRRIAIVGSGVSGLTAAYLLARSHEVVVYEADQRVGGHSHTVSVNTADGNLGIDTGFIVYNRRTYPELLPPARSARRRHAAQRHELQLPRRRG